MCSRWWEGGLEPSFCTNSPNNVRIVWKTQERSGEIRVIFASGVNNNQNEIRGSHWCEIKVTSLLGCDNFVSR
jgi:hypothetical protein